MPSALIVGAGPVGLTMAVELVRHGVEVRIVDCAPTATDKSKALVLWARTLELLAGSPGLVERFVAAGTWARAANIFGNRKRLVHLEFDRQDTAFPRPLMIPQCDTERLLTEYLSERGVRVERPVRLVELSQTTDKVLATLTISDGSSEQVRCDWLLGCDGSHSTTRHQLGIQFVGEFEPNDWILADVDADGPIEHDAINIFWHSRGIVATFPIRGKRCRVVANLGLAPGTDRPADPSLAEAQATIDQRGLSDLRLSNPIWLAGFRIHERMVGEYCRGRVFLAGDAAHIHSPAGGQGMNTGMQDACNLAWKLALVQQGKAKPGLLESYSVERTEVGKMVLSNASRLTGVATLRNPFLQFIRNHAAQFLGSLTAVQQRMIAELTEMAVHYQASPLSGDDPGNAWSDEVRPGDRVPDAKLNDSSGKSVQLLSLDLRRHQLLVLPDSAALGELPRLMSEARALCAQFKDCIVPRVILPQGATPTTEAFVDTGEVRSRLGVRGTALALARPDLYLGFRGHAGSLSALEQHLNEYLRQDAT